MNTRRNRQVYQNADRNAVVESDSPHALIAVLFDELLRQMRGFAAEVESEKMRKSDPSEHFTRSLTILYGLQSSLNFEDGGEIASNLFRLYEYTRQQLLNSMQTRELAGTHAAIDALENIRDAWREIDRPGTRS
jgi:flagellar protein FliS